MSSGDAYGESIIVGVPAGAGGGVSITKPSRGWRRRHNYRGGFNRGVSTGDGGVVRNMGAGVNMGRGWCHQGMHDV